MLRREDITKTIQSYFIRKIEEGIGCVDVVDASADLIRLMRELPAYDMKGVEMKLQEKRYWDAAAIVKGGWEQWT